MVPKRSVNLGWAAGQFFCAEGWLDYKVVVSRVYNIKLRARRRGSLFLIRKCTREATWKAVISPSALGAFRFRSLPFLCAAQASSSFCCCAALFACGGGVVGRDPPANSGPQVIRFDSAPVVAIGGQIVVVDAPSASLNSGHADALSLIEAWERVCSGHTGRCRELHDAFALGAGVCGLRILGSFAVSLPRRDASRQASRRRPRIANPTACVATVRIGLSAQTALRRAAGPW